MKRCAKCLQDRPLSDFTAKRVVRGEVQLKSVCRECHTAYARVLRKRAKDARPIPPPLSEEEVARRAADALERKRTARKRTYEKNKPKVLATAARYRAAHRAEEGLARRAHYQRNKEKVAASTKAYREAHREMYAEAGAQRRAAKRRATPKWADRSKISDWYLLAKLMTEETGVRHEVDHVIPLQGENVCGLHWEGNLQVLTRYENRSKANRCVSVSVVPGLS